PNHEQHIETVQETLKSLDALDKPTLFVFNKIDLYRDRFFDELLEEGETNEIRDSLAQNLKNRFEHDNVFISAINKENVETLREKLTKVIKEQYVTRYPFQAKQW
ncbi:MAG: GTPase HflX, partial [Phaeodactylibacter sp.]|nr:GTPase HflX [Phaeodactylibacter sp.]